MRARAAALFVVLAVTLVGCEGGSKSTARTRAQPAAGSWKTWVLSSASEVNVPPPPTGTAAEGEVRDVRDLARQRSGQAEEKVRQWGQDPPVKPWLDVNLELVAAGVKDPPVAVRGYALTSVAMYDAVVAAWHWKYQYNRKAPDSSPSSAPDPSYPSEHAAIAGAASRVLAYLFPERPRARFDELAEEAAMSRVEAGANSRSDVEAGLSLGRAVADRVIERARSDGSDRKWDGTRPAGVGRGPQFWEPPPGTVTPPTQPLAGTWRTWVLSSASELRPGPPPAFGSPEHVAQAREVMEVGAKLSDEQKRVTQFWAGGQGTTLPPGVWNQAALSYLQRDRLDTPHAARALALLNVAQADACFAVWDAKFAYWSARPQNGIRDLGLDRSWTPYLPTPSFPSYVSGHAGFSGAGAAVLSYLFPNDAEVLEAKAQEAALSRLYGGIHYRVDNDAGLRLGHEVGRLVVERAKADGSGSD